MKSGWSLDVNCAAWLLSESNVCPVAFSFTICYEVQGNGDFWSDNA